MISDFWLYMYIFFMHYAYRMHDQNVVITCKNEQLKLVIEIDLWN